MYIEGYVGMEIHRLEQKAHHIRTLSDTPNSVPGLRQRAGQWMIDTGCRIAGASTPACAPSEPVSSSRTGVSST
jgi:hypothetical protein